MKTRIVYLVLGVLSWGTDDEDDAVKRFDLPASSGQGWCPVFENLADAEREWPDKEIMELVMEGGRLDAFAPADA